MFKAVIAWIGLSALVALVPMPARAQTNLGGAAAASSAIPNRANVRSGTHRARSQHRNTLPRQRARATSQHTRQLRAPPNNR
jgi:hypothetical protein